MLSPDIYNRICNRYLRRKTNLQIPSSNSAIHTALSSLDRSFGESCDDLSVEDALFDIQLRGFFQAEFGHIEPPGEMFVGLSVAIADGGRRTMDDSKTHHLSSVVHRPSSTIRQAWLLARSNAGRITSGALATALILLALGGNNARILDKLGVGIAANDISLTAPSIKDLNSDIGHEAVAGMVVDRSNPTFASGPDDVQIYDPVELRQEPARRSPFATNRPRYIEYGKKAMGY